MHTESLSIDRGNGKKAFSRLGFTLFVYMLLSSGLGVLASAFLPSLIPDYFASGLVWVTVFVTQYVISLPVGILLLMRLPGDFIPQSKLSPGGFFVAFLVSYFMLTLGSMVSVPINLLSELFGQSDFSVASSLSEFPLWARMLFLVVCAPIFEELFFRKLLIERLARYGEWVAIFVSALAFGLFHGNFQQFFYAFTVGLALGYIFIKTGRLRYTIIIHAIINFLSGVLGGILLENGDIISLGIFESLVIFPCYICGMILFFRMLRKEQIIFRPAVSYLLPQKGWGKTVFGNTGMICFIALCGVFFALTVVG